MPPSRIEADHDDCSLMAVLCVGCAGHVDDAFVVGCGVHVPDAAAWAEEVEEFGWGGGGWPEGCGGFGEGLFAVRDGGVVVIEALWTDG